MFRIFRQPDEDGTIISTEVTCKEILCYLRDLARGRRTA